MYARGCAREYASDTDGWITHGVGEFEQASCPEGTPYPDLIPCSGKIVR